MSSVFSWRRKKRVTSESIVSTLFMCTHGAPLTLCTDRKHHAQTGCFFRRAKFHDRLLPSRDFYAGCKHFPHQSKERASDVQFLSVGDGAPRHCWFYTKLCWSVCCRSKSQILIITSVFVPMSLWNLYCTHSSPAVLITTNRKNTKYALSGGIYTRVIKTEFEIKRFKEGVYCYSL